MRCCVAGERSVRTSDDRERRLRGHLLQPHPEQVGPSVRRTGVQRRTLQGEAGL